jgi:hypothetical protein
MSHTEIIKQTRNNDIKSRRNNPKIPNFNNNAARNNDIEELASQCTSGNQKKKG